MSDLESSLLEAALDFARTRASITDDETLSRPAFEPFPAGIVIAAETNGHGTAPVPGSGGCPRWLGIRTERSPVGSPAAPPPD